MLVLSKEHYSEQVLRMNFILVVLCACQGQSSAPHYLGIQGRWKNHLIAFAGEREKTHASQQGHTIPKIAIHAHDKCADLLRYLSDNLECFGAQQQGAQNFKAINLGSEFTVGPHCFRP
jgi:hypothetical protein